MAKLSLRRGIFTGLDGPLRTRFAPSPTGFMHLGGLRTALFNYLLAKKTDGKFLLRIEDTDQARTVPGAQENLVSILKWAGIEPSPSHKVIQQSTRLDFYRRLADELVAEGKAYRCFCTKERLEELRSASHSGYDGKCRNLYDNGRGSPHVVRLRVPRDSKRSTFHDHVFGHISVDPEEIDDVILIKADGFPTYHFASVIDDHESGVNLVMRGREWLPSTPLHTLLYNIFGWPRPAFAHLPLLIKPDGTKLSKRQGDSFVDHYRSAGYLPEALVNFVAFLGWSPSGLHSDVMDIEGLTRIFSLKDINRAESRVDVAKLDWLNRKHLAKCWDSSPKTLTLDLKTILESEYPDLIRDAFNARVISEPYLTLAISLIKDRIHTLKDIPKLCPYLFVTPQYACTESMPLEPAPTIYITEFCYERLSNLAEFSHDIVASCFVDVKERFAHMPPTKIMMTLRLALTDTKVGASLVDTAVLLGKDECMKRLQLALFSFQSKLKEI